MEVYSDTDWSGCPITRKSTSGGAIMVGNHVLKTWSSTISSVSLSSGEAEFYGVVRSAGMGLGFQSLLKDYGIELPLRVWTDSTAAAGICARQGLGGQRHIATHSLWVQQAIRSGRFVLKKIDGERNPADLMTKHMPSREKLSTLVRLFGCTYASGRADAAPATRQADGTKATMAEYSGVNRIDHDESWELPHTRGEAYVRQKFATVKPSAEGACDEDLAQDETILGHGTEIARQIIADTQKYGRRRVLPNASEDQVHVTTPEASHRRNTSNNDAQRGPPKRPKPRH